MTEDWSRWYKKDYPVTAERCFVELLPSLSANIRNVIDFGCAAGRNLEPFNGRYKLWGVDLPPARSIEWRSQFADLTYIQSSLQSFSIDRSLRDFLCISHGAIMYLAPEEQRRFMGYLVERGCKNFIFQEYDEPTLRASGYHPPTVLNRILKRNFGYAFCNPFGFEKRWYRDAIPCWARLDDAAVH